MTLYLFGNLMGRLLLSFVVVWIIVFLAMRLDWRKAFRGSVRWYGIVGTLLLFALGVVASQRSGSLVF
jgi:hypothetical protein